MQLRRATQVVLWAEAPVVQGGVLVSYRETVSKSSLPDMAGEPASVVWNSMDDGYPGFGTICWCVAGILHITFTRLDEETDESILIPANVLKAAIRFLEDSRRETIEE